MHWRKTMQLAGVGTIASVICYTRSMEIIMHSEFNQNYGKAVYVKI